MDRWQLLSNEIAFQSPWMCVRTKRYQVQPDAPPEDYYVVERRSFVIVIARVAGRVVFIRHFRPGHDRYYWELPSGYIDPGEDPEQAAVRELREETGYTATACRQIGVLHPLAGYVTTAGHVILAEVAGDPAADFDRDEIEEVTTFGWDEAIDMIVAGTLNDAQVVSSLLLAREILARGSNSRP